MKPYAPTNPKKLTGTPFNRRNIDRTSRAFNSYTFCFPKLRTLLDTPAVILDLGAGDSNFATTVHNSGGHYPATIVRCDLGYFYGEPYDRRLAVAGDACRLPFRDESFDAVVCSWMLLHFSRREALMTIQGVIRTLKPGAEAYISPWQPELTSADLQPFENLTYTNCGGQATLHKNAPEAILAS